MLSSRLAVLLSILSFTCSSVVSESSRVLTRSTSFPSLFDASLDDLVVGLERGLFTSEDLVRAYSARIDEINDTLHAVTEINPDALSIAVSLDSMRKNGQVLGPLHGIPILIKNNIATNDEMNNTAGSFALLGSKVPRDSTMAVKLREAGAIILGKANLSQWANFRSSNTSNGWSAHGGQVYGAFYPGQDPSGSSSGSGLSSSIGLALASLGTETSGSIICPASANNIVGIKPTVGLTSRYLVVPVSEHQDTVGPMAHSVKDAAYLLQAIAGRDSRDNYTSAIPHDGHIPDYVAACDYNAFSGARIGVARNVIEIWKAYTDPPVLAAFDEAVEQIRQAGATIVDANFTAFDDWEHDGNETMVLYADFLANLPQYLRELTVNPNNITDLASVQAYTHQHGSTTEQWPQRNTYTWDGALNQSWNNSDGRFWAAYQANLAYGDAGGILGALERADVGAVLLPTQLSSPIPALVGSPVITVPMGFYPPDWGVTLNKFGDLVVTAPNVPFGLSFMGPRFGEEALIGYAYAYEQRTMHRYDVPPFVAPAVDLEDVVKSARLYGKQDKRQCSKDWVERCGMVEGWPSVMWKMGARSKKAWSEAILGERSDTNLTDVMEET